MCGILAVAGPAALRGDLRPLVVELLGSRGPDGVYRRVFDLDGTPLQIAHAQFHVMDRSGAGAQPMASASGNSVIAFNGEIFDHPELAAAIGPPAGGWRTRSDTEVLLEGLERFGPEFLERVNGMFAFVFVRLDRREVLVARDRLGIRPLYFATRGESWAIGSTVRSVLAAGVVPFELSTPGLRSFLTFGSVYEPRTIARHVEAIEPGTWRRFRPDHGWESRRWWTLPEPTDDLDPLDAADRARAILVDAIDKRTRSGFPLGAFISGGTDSSALALLLAEEIDHPFTSFSLVYEGRDARFSEATYQREIVKRCGRQHHEVIVRRADAEAQLEPYFAAMDQPSVDGFNVFLITREAARAGARTCISGTGGDEVFAGYAPFASVERFGRLLERLQSLPGFMRGALSSPVAALARLRPLEPRLSKPALILARIRGLAEYYALRRTVFLPAQVERMCGDGPGDLGDELSYRPDYRSTDLVSTWSGLELGNYVRNTLLRDGDVFGMAHTVELRFPMLDHRLIECVFRVGGEAKLSRREHKPLLQAVLRGELPRYTWDRPKRGFTLPLEQWLRRGFLPAPDLSGWLDPAEVAAVVRGFHRSPSNRRSWSRLWALHALERCLRRGYPALASPP